MIIANENFSGFHTEFVFGNDTLVLNPQSPWKWFSDNIFYNTFYFKCRDKLATLPDISFSLLDDDEKATVTKVIEAKDVEILPMAPKENYASVLAKSLIVKNSNVSHFDDSSNIVVLEIETDYGNLDDFHLENVLRDGIESHENNFPKSMIYYFAIIPKEAKRFSFSFFNLISNNFEEVFIPIIIDNQNVSTQTDINPKKSRFELYKNIIIASVALTFLIVFLIRRKKLYLLVSISILIYLLFFRSTFNEVVIKSNSNIKILPTKNSTIFYTTTKATFAQKITSKDDYIKVILPNTQVGWVKKDRLEEN